MKLNGLKQVLLALGLFGGLQVVFAQQAAAKGARIDAPCIQAAIGARDTALTEVVGDWASTMRQALEARRDALKESWGVKDYKSRRTAQRKAWNDYRKSLSRANAAKAKERSRIWKKFEHDRRECEGAYSPEMITGSKYDANL